METRSYLKRVGEFGYASSHVAIQQLVMREPEATAEETMKLE